MGRKWIIGSDGNKCMAKMEGISRGWEGNALQRVEGRE